jgi:16S rRNA G966 N2-methylase RsmD
MEKECSFESNIVTIENLKETLKSIKPCPLCMRITLKKFKAINQQICIKTLDNNFAKCKCGKRPLDVVMAHVLKIMNDNRLIEKPLTLKNGPLPLIKVLESEIEFPMITKDSLILLDPNFNKEIANILINEVNEVFGVLKGNSKDLVGNLTVNHTKNNYELLAGCDICCDIVKTPFGKIIINKRQHLVHIEFPLTIENKILKLDNYFKSEFIDEEKIKNISILDGTAGSGSIGLYSLKYGFKKVFFNDINSDAIELTGVNLQANGFDIKKSDDKNLEYYGDDFKIYNLSLEDFSDKFLNKEIVIDEKKDMDDSEIKFDYCILDIYPQEDPDYFKEIAKKIAKNIILI